MVDCDFQHCNKLFSWTTLLSTTGLNDHMIYLYGNRVESTVIANHDQLK